MNLSVIQNISTVEYYPYPYVIVEDALPNKLYNELHNSFPDKLLLEQPAEDIDYVTGKPICYRYKSSKAAQEQVIPNIWKDFFEYHTSAEYFRACARLFEKPIIEYYSAEFYENLLSDPVGVRKLRKGPLVTDCQFVLHEALGETSTTKVPHMDNSKEIYAGLLYMKHHDDKSTGGDFVVHEVDTNNDQWFNPQGGRNVLDGFHRPYNVVPYKQNMFTMFLNVFNSIHSVTPRKNAVERRYSINIIGEFKDKKMWEH
jgi:hypothetical protein